MNKAKTTGSLSRGAALRHAATPSDEEIYQDIYTAIVERHVAPGTKVPEDVLARAFDVSRTRVRKILFRLAHENLVTLRPNRGASIARPTVKEARDVFMARRILESGAVAAIAAAGNNDRMKLLSRVVSQERRAHQQNDRRAAIKLSGEFHLVLTGLLDNPTLTEVLRALISRTSLIVSVYEPPGTSGCLHEDHARLIELISKGHATAAATCMTQHLEAVKDSLDFAQLNQPMDKLSDIFARVRSARS